ncbi:MFS transporter [Agromyces sp. MMS24-JH15]|uniref:MFS transporter n=1 Tax=Agromyces sp. MMS24-JH15 TaxID=3243765 RepID=UPI003748AA3D
MPRPPASPDVRRARWALLVQFALFGLVMTSWMTRLPSVTEALGLSAADLGRLLFLGGLGTLVGAFTVGAVVARFGSRRTLAAGTAGNVVGFGLLALSVATASPDLFAAGTAVNGVCAAFVNVPINLNAAAVERRLGRAVLPQFHATFSLGAAAGALVAAGFAAAGLGVGIQLVIVTFAVTGLRAWLLGPSTSLTTPGHPAATASVQAVPASGRRPFSSAFGAWLEPHTLLLGVVLLAGSLTEGSANTWLSLALVEGFDQAESVGAVAYGTFVVAMTALRLLGTGLIDRFGRVAVLRASGVSALAGLLLFVFAPAVGAAWIGIVLWGAGAALTSPIALAAASDEPVRAGQRMSVVTSFSTIAAITAPPLLGVLADAVGLRHALLAIGVFVVLSLVMAGQVRRPADAPRPAPTARPAPAPAGVEAPAAPRADALADA